MKRYWLFGIENNNRKEGNPSDVINNANLEFLLRIK